VGQTAVVWVPSVVFATGVRRLRFLGLGVEGCRRRGSEQSPRGVHAVGRLCYSWQGPLRQDQSARAGEAGVAFFVPAKISKALSNQGAARGP
jgi:hypothetical protein